jgi:2-polyprenyl-6-methoxyphenol hydroxylase-like FAD-dependent oxidoreductase
MSKLTDVIIIGAGPTGLTAAIEAARHGLSVRIVDRQDARSAFSKALVAHARTLEIFHNMGLIEKVLAAGTIFKALNVYDQNKAMMRIVFEQLAWRDALYPFWLSIPQSETERCLEEKLTQLGIQVERQTELDDLEQQPDLVRLTLKHTDGSREIADAAWVVGCDGARSTVRKLLNLDFEGRAEDEMFILADVGIESDLPEDEGYNVLSSDGVMLIVPLPVPHYRRLIFHMPSLKPHEDPEITLASLQALIDKRTYLPVKLTDLGWTSHFSVKHFVVSQHRHGRVCLAGDAAHIHSPVGGQGMNSGIQDAYNLMWKLALVQHGQAKPLLLDSYEAERHPVAKNLIKRVSIATRIITTSHPISRILRNQLGRLLINTKAVKNRLGRNVAMLDLNYRKSPIVQEDTQSESLLTNVFLRRGQKLSGFHKGPKAGYRAPNVIFQSSGSAVKALWDYFYGTEHILLMFMGLNEAASIKTTCTLAEQIQAQYQASFRPILVARKDHFPDAPSPFVLLDACDTVHRAYGASNPCLYVIRPDQYIAYRSQSLNPDSLIGYLDRILHRKQA